MDAFTGTWFVDPTQAAGLEDLFDYIAPPGLSKEDLMTPHNIEVGLEGNKMTMKTVIPGKPVVESSLVVGEKTIKDGPGDIKIEVSSRFEEATGRIYMTTDVPDILTINVVRYIKDGCMVSEFATDGKSWTVKMTRP